MIIRAFTVPPSQAAEWRTVMPQSAEEPTNELDQMVSDAHGDLIHDNFVPRYSKLGEGHISRIVLIGVWLLFAPAVIFVLSTVYGFSRISDFSPWLRGVTVVLLLLTSLVCVAILVKVTRRYIRQRHVSH